MSFQLNHQNNNLGDYINTSLMNNQNYKKAYEEDIKELRRIEENDKYLALKYVYNLIREIKIIDPIDEHREFYKQCLYDLEYEKDILLENIDINQETKIRKKSLKLI